MKRAMLSIIAMGLALSTPASARLIDRVVAVVNDEVITLSELQEAAAPDLARERSIANPIERVKFRQSLMEQTLDQLVGEHLVGQEAERRNIKIGEGDIDAHLNDVRQRQGWTEAQLDSYLISIGTTRDRFRDTIRRRLLQQRVVGLVVRSRIRISDEDLEDYYKEKRTREQSTFEVEAAHLVLKVRQDGTPAEKAAVKQLATELAERARNGEDFTALVKQYSNGPGAANGGYLGRLRRGSLNAAMEAVIFDLEPGKIGGPIETPYGLHLVHVIGRHTVAPAAFEEVKETLRREVQQRRMAKEFTRWIEELKTKAFIELRL